MQEALFHKLSTFPSITANYKETSIGSVCIYVRLAFYICAVYLNKNYISETCFPDFIDATIITIKRQ